MGGIALVTLGAIALSTATDLKTALKENDPTFAAIALIVFGGIVFLISFFGCCGAIRESYCMTMTYASIMLILIIGQVVIAVIIFTHKTDFQNVMVKALDKIFADAKAPGNQETVRVIEETVKINQFLNF